MKKQKIITLFILDLDIFLIVYPVKKNYRRTKISLTKGCCNSNSSQLRKRTPVIAGVEDIWGNFAH